MSQVTEHGLATQFARTDVIYSSAVKVVEKWNRSGSLGHNIMLIDRWKAIKTTRLTVPYLLIKVLKVLLNGFVFLNPLAAC